MNNVSATILASIAALVIHLIEEVKAGFRAQFPLGEMPKPIFIGINVLIYGFGLATFFLSLGNGPLAVPLAWIWAIAMLFNGVGHLGIMLIKHRYVPGGLTAPVLALVAGYLIWLLLLGK
jgi:hypothetical protein